MSFFETKKNQMNVNFVLLAIYEKSQVNGMSYSTIIVCQNIVHLKHTLPSRHSLLEDGPGPTGEYCAEKRMKTEVISTHDFILVTLCICVQATIASTGRLGVSVGRRVLDLEI